MDNEGQIVHKPPLFEGEKFNYFKQQMTTFFKSWYMNLMNIVDKENLIPINITNETLPIIYGQIRTTRYIFST